ncbi:amelotin [Pyxicephalus adspersus]|uniref:amelotin n=1 Tax=Pyxicephalus adspersus TaxID=30357 RepID=UPI003B59F03E
MKCLVKTMTVFSYRFPKGSRMMMITMILLHCLVKSSSGFPLLRLMQMYNPLGRLPQHSEVNRFMMTPSQLLQNQLSQMVPPYQVLSNYFLFENPLMQPRIPQSQLLPTYPMYGNILPLSVGPPNTQMLPIVFTQVGQQGLLSGSDSEENLVAGVIMMPVDPGLQGNIITIHPGGVSISGTDGVNVAVQPALNPIGQQGINITIQANETVFVAGDLPGDVPPEWGRNDSPGAGIIKPTYSPPIGLQQTLPYSEPTVPPEMNRGDMPESPGPVTEDWILCNSYLPDHEEYQSLPRGDGHVPVMAPNFFLIPDMFNDENQNV